MTKIDRAIEVLKDDGYFRKQLETNYHGQEKFVTRLRNKHGQVIKGIGIKTFFALEDEGVLVQRHVRASSTWASEYVWKGE